MEALTYWCNTHCTSLHKLQFGGDHYLRPEEDRSNTVETSARISYPRWYWRTVYPTCLSQLRSPHFISLEVGLTQKLSWVHVYTTTKLTCFVWQSLTVMLHLINACNLQWCSCAYAHGKTQQAPSKSHTLRWNHC